MGYKLGEAGHRAVHFHNMVAAVIFGLARARVLGLNPETDHHTNEAEGVEEQLSARSTMLASVAAGTFARETEWGPGRYYINSSVMRLVSLAELLSRTHYQDEKAIFRQHPALGKLVDRRNRVIHSRLGSRRVEVSYLEAIEALELVLDLYEGHAPEAQGRL